MKTSISHHLDRVAVAVSASTDGLGIDLERPRAGLDSARIAARWFSADEQALLAQAETEQMSALFYRLWTLKEAWVKATGRGLAGHLQAIRAEIDPAYGWRLKGDTEVTGWQAWSGMVEGHWLAVIWRSEEWQLPGFEEATLAGDTCAEVQAATLTAPVHLAIEPCSGTGSSF